MNFLLGTRSTKPQVKPPPEAQPGEPSKSHSAMSSKHGRNTPMTKSEEFTFVMQDSSDEVQRSHIPVTSSEIKIKDSAEPRAALQKKDEEIEHLKSELNHLFYFSKDQEAGTSNLTKTIAAADKKMRSLQQGLEASQRDLQACRDDLFRFQPAAQVPDSNIAKDYDLLCHEVTNWIDEEIVAFEKSTQYTKSEQLFSAPEGSEVAVLLDEYPESGEHLISYLVHSCLVEAIFGESVYLLGLSEGATKLLQKAEQGMEKLESKKDRASIKLWRSETVRALATANEYEGEKNAKAREVAEDLIGRLADFFPIVRGKHESKKRLYNQVLLPAAELATKINGSLSTYSLAMEIRHPFQSRVLLADHLEVYRLVDIRTRKTLKPESGVTADRKGRIGTVIMPLEPALSRVDTDGKRVELRPDTLLIQLIYPLKKRGHGSR